MNLQAKYNIQAPRYTSYPAVPYWNNKMDQRTWLMGIKNSSKLNDGVDLYIHIPFCQSLCWYCGCHRIITKDQSKEKHYLELLLDEWKIYSDFLGDIKINSLHLGGGTPNFFTAEAMEKLFTTILKNKSDKFIGAIEIDPRTFQEDHLRVLKRFGFSRISMGIQDFDERVQKAINRIQSYELVEKLCRKLRENGFNSINFDLIYGLPLQTNATIQDTIEKTIKLKPNMIAFYSYAHVPWKVKNQKLIKEEQLPNPALKQSLFILGEKFLLEHDYEKIGFDHFALKDSYLAQKKSDKKLKRSFMGYTDEKSEIQIGLGVSSIGQAEHGFFQNSKELSSYSAHINKGELAQEFGHLNQGNDAKIEHQLQELFCNYQVNLDSLNLNNEQIDRLSDMSRDGILEFNGKKLNVTDFGISYLRNIATVFDEYYKQSDKIFSKTI